MLLLISHLALSYQKIDLFGMELQMVFLLCVVLTTRERRFRTVWLRNAQILLQIRIFGRQFGLRRFPIQLKLLFGGHVRMLSQLEIT
jgi:hypothetical protein